MSESHRSNALPQFDAPVIRQLAVAVEPVSPASLVKDLLDRFRSQADLLIVPVIGDNGEYLGLVSRRMLLSFMTQTYAMDLFGRKSILELIHQKPELAAMPLVAQPEDRVDQIMRQLLVRDPAMKHESLPVLEDNRFIGVVKVTDMMVSLSETQGKLIEVMHGLSARIHEEVAQAALLQRNLLPPGDIRLPGLRGTATLVTSTEVGGDYYDYYCVEQRWVVLLIGDVSGHGVASGTLVSAAKAGINLLSAEGERDPGSILNRLNHAVLKIAHQRLLMTLFCACLDTYTGELHYANAGHQFPYLYRYVLGGMEVLETGGAPLGKSQDSIYISASTQLDVGDRLFFYTDGILEEENNVGEPFGYDRLEEVIYDNFHGSLDQVGENLLESLRSFTGKGQFEDDVTVVCVEHHERNAAPRREEGQENELGLVRIAETFYRANTEPLIPRLSRQNLVFLAENEFSDLLPRLARDGIRRVLPRRQPIIRRLGWEKLLAQHQPSRFDDLNGLLPKPEHAREFQIRHSLDKEFVIQETEAWLMDLGLVEADRLDAVAMLLDELIENGLYAAPRDGKGRPFYAKGEEREMSDSEMLCLKVALQDGILGLHLLDSWGTLTPVVFLNRLVRHVEGGGLIAGVGGGGLFLIWRLADYLQFRVHPHHQTQATVLIDLQSPQDNETYKGFQFIYHSEIHENLEHEPFNANHYAKACD